MAKPKRPRPITLSDTAATTGRILNPVGTYVSSPSTALYGQQGQYGSGLPTDGVGGGMNAYGKVIAQTGEGQQGMYNGQRLGQNTTVTTTAPERSWLSQFWNVLNGGSWDNENVPSGLTGVRGSTTPNGTSKQASLVRAPQFGDGANGGFDNSLIPNAPSNYSIRSLGTNVQDSDSAIRMARQNILNNPTPNVRTSGRSSFGATPQAMDDLTARIAYMSPDELNGFLTTMPASQRDAVERVLTQGQNQNITGVQNVNGQDLYKTDTGARLDEQGKEVWNPKTATTDVYGGKFVQEGEKKWVRLSNGKVVRQVASKGRWRSEKRRGGGGSAGSEEARPTQTDSGSTGSYGLVSFNTGTG